MISIPIYKATCETCGCAFDIPLLPGQSYGQFILFGGNGRTFAYLNAVESDGFQRITDLAKKIASEGHDRFESAERFQWLVGKCLDAIDNVALSMVSGPICPVCQSRAIEYGEQQKTGNLELPEATFAAFMTLSYSGQMERITSLIKEWEQDCKSGEEAA